jgi:hypothetical protein
MVTLVKALAELTANPPPRLYPPPEPPPIPFEYLYRIASAMGTDKIPPDQQDELINVLRLKLRDETDEVARADIVKLLSELGNRPELTVANSQEIDAILRGQVPPAAQRAQAPPDWLRAMVSGPAKAQERGGGVFISYRRENTSHIAGRIADWLINQLGEQQVFMDVDSIELGLDFHDVIANAVGRCDILLAVIGPGWATVRDHNDQSRLDDADDLVRLEIEAALTRDIRVIPVLVDGAEMPRAQDLPASLTSLSRRNGLKIRHDSFRQDIGRLLDTIRRVLRSQP